MKFKKCVLLSLSVISLIGCNSKTNLNRKVYLYYGENITVVENVKIGDSYTAPTRVATEAYDFIGWYFNPAFTSTMRVNFPLTIDDDVHLYANYKIKSFAITYYMNNDAAFMDSLKTVVNWGQKITYIDPTIYIDPKREFLGWYLNKECTGSQWNFSQGVFQHTDLFAKWGKLIA